MLTVTNLAGFGAGLRGASNVSLTFLTSDESTADGSSYTFSAQSFGTASSGRYIIATVHQGGGNVSISAITIGGISASVVASTVSSAGTAGSYIAIASVPTGATGSVVVTFSGGTSRCAIGLFSVTGLANSSPYAAATATSSSSGVISTSLNVPAYGFVISCATTADGSAWSWTAGATEQYDRYPESQIGTSGAMQTYVAAQTPLAVSATCATGSRSSMASASWGNG